MQTLLLDQARWDVCLDASGNIALAGEPYAVAQDVASALRLFKGELWYDTTKGVPYFQQILGRFPPLQIVKEAFAAAARSVPGVRGVAVILTGLRGRELSGRVVTSAGVIALASDPSGTVTAL